MSLFNFFKRNRKNDQGQPIDRSLWTGKDFEFLITGDIDLPADTYDSIMTPNSFQWTRVERDNWIYYQVGQDEFSYSWEMPGIQMTFNDAIPFQKAKEIAGEVIENLKRTGRMVELLILDKTKVYRFD